MGAEQAIATCGAKGGTRAARSLREVGLRPPRGAVCRRGRFPAPLLRVLVLSLRTEFGLKRLERLMVRKEGLEPSRCYPQVPETCASTSSATFAGSEMVAAESETVK